MITLCANNPLPTFKSLYDSVVDNLKFPPIAIEIPTLPTLKTPIYEGFSNTNMEILQLIQGLQDFQFQTTLMALIQPLVSVVGGALEDILPKIPHTDLTLIDLLASNPSHIYDVIAAAIAEHGLGIFPFVPKPMFGSFSIPAIEAVNVVKMVVRGYYIAVLNVISSLIDQVTDILELAGLGVLPTIPTLSAITAALMAAFPQFDNLSALIQSGIGIQDIFSMLLFSGFPPIAIPNPLIPSFSSHEIEFQEALSIIYSDFLTIPLAIIIDFVQDTLGMLGFSFPLLCISF
ncbi:hypothetical protein [Agitococcus lubricus]|uniref:Uncharacterized protein n=1 Tax=Agitococcus lubricus TaxID=1077255 RepID=A0A2T5J3T5_9GAMM|nr:hypothetical protein [Agitococcus lubricus]PTQ91279.1 hypothetical protein C8N29_101352 [Agitococcus lubricus]